MARLPHFCVNVTSHMAVVYPKAVSRSLKERVLLLDCTH